MSSHPPTVFVVDDDASIRRSLQRLLSSAGYRTVVCDSAEAFLAVHDIPDRSCVVLDVRMPGMTGTELQMVLRESHPALPVILSSGHVDAARASTPAEPVAFLQKPFDAADLFRALDEAFERCATARPHSGDRGLPGAS